MDRATLLRHLRVTHFESGDRGQASADARRIAIYPVDQGASRVVGVGSTFVAFRQRMEDFVCWMLDREAR